MRSTLLLASFLAVVPIISATPTHPLVARQSTPILVTTVQVTGGHFDLVDCYTDSQNPKILAHQVTPKTVTVDDCMNACVGSTMAGVEVVNGAQTCFCDNQFNGNLDTLGIELTECEVPCQDNPNEFCGGTNNLLFYQFTNNTKS